MCASRYTYPRRPLPSLGTPGQLFFALASLFLRLGLANTFFPGSLAPRTVTRGQGFSLEHPQHTKQASAWGVEGGHPVPAVALPFRRFLFRRHLEAGLKENSDNYYTKQTVVRPSARICKTEYKKFLPKNSKRHIFSPKFFYQNSQTR